MVLTRSERRSSLVLRDLAEPSAGTDELVLRVSTCAVCRTDLQICQGDLPLHRVPIVPGHQVVGTVVDVGEGVEEWRVGERAGIGWLASTCGTCPACLSGRENLCPTARFTGWDEDGGYEELIRVRAAFALRLPPRFDDVAASPLLCGGIIGFRALRLAGAEAGGRLGLYGFGASATLALQVARHWGCRVFVATRSQADRERALAMGAEWAGDAVSRPPEPLDAAVTFAPSGDVVRAALLALDRGASLAINAIYLDRIPELSYEALYWERRLLGVANYTRADARDFLTLADQIPLRPAFEVHPLSDANLALSRLAAGLVEGAAVLQVR